MVRARNAGQAPGQRKEIMEIARYKIVVTFEADGEIWSPLGPAANRHGVWRCRSLLSGRRAYFAASTVCARAS